MVRPVIRPAHSADFDEVARIWFESWRTVGVVVAQDVSIEELAARIPDDIDKGWDLYVAEQGGVIRAMMALLPGDQQLDQLFVDPPFHGQGIGTQLLDFAKVQMPGGMGLRTAKANSKAIAFYERHGFVHVRDDLHPRLRYPIVYYRWPGVA